MANVTIGDTPPGDPIPGDIWWDSDAGNAFIWYDDGDSVQWVAMTQTGPQATWVEMTQAAYDALPAKDPNTLYIITG
jgi:hypothetical protein